MKDKTYAIITDIHSNLESLKSSLAIIVTSLPLANSVQIHLNSDISWLRLSNVNANEAYSNYLSTIFAN